MFHGERSRKYMTFFSPDRTSRRSVDSLLYWRGNGLDKLVHRLLRTSYPGYFPACLAGCADLDPVFPHDRTVSGGIRKWPSLIVPPAAGPVFPAVGKKAMVPRGTGFPSSVTRPTTSALLASGPGPQPVHAVVKKQTVMAANFIGWVAGKLAL